MSMFSCVKKLDELHFADIKTMQKVGVEELVAIQDGKHEPFALIVCKLKNGRYWTNWSTVRKFALMPGDWTHMDKLLRGLVKLGYITGAERKAHIDYCSRAVARKDLKYEQEKYDRLATRYGLPATTLTPLVKP